MLRIFFVINKFFLESKILQFKFFLASSNLDAVHLFSSEDKSFQDKCMQEMFKELSQARAKYIKLLNERIKVLDRMVFPSVHITGRTNAKSLQLASKKCAKYEKERRKIKDDLNFYCGEDEKPPCYGVEGLT